MALPVPARLSPEQYLEMERASDVKHEYWHGEVFAMSGARKDHDRICANLSFSLQLVLRNGPCDVFTSDMKVGVTKKRGFAYPDFTIACGDQKFYDDVQDVLMNPCVIFEVLSAGTRKHDSTVKVLEYQRMESLRHYVMIEQDEMLVQHLEKTAEGLWLHQILHQPQDQLVLTAAGITITLADIYFRVNLPKPDPDDAGSD